MVVGTIPRWIRKANLIVGRGSETRNPLVMTKRRGTISLTSSWLNKKNQKKEHESLIMISIPISG
jgi:hypothetical protein